jgi:hypothetical protein
VRGRNFVREVRFRLMLASNVRIHVAFPTGFPQLLTTCALNIATHLLSIFLSTALAARVVTVAMCERVHSDHVSLVSMVVNEFNLILSNERSVPSTSL